MMTSTAPVTAVREAAGRHVTLWDQRWSVRVGTALALALIASVVVAVTVGPAPLNPVQVFSSILSHLGITTHGLSITDDAIVWQLRMPRVLTAAAVGATLAVCGTTMQATTRNPLADPYLLGLSSGASLGAVIVIVLGFSIALPVAAFAGAMLALGATVVLTGIRTALRPSRMILAGVAVSAGMSAMTSFVIFWSATGDSYREILSWLLGSLSGATWASAIMVVAVFVFIGFPVLFSGSLLDAFAFGDRSAGALGVNVRGARWMLLSATALLTGVAVSVSGAIGFIGVMIPHAVRLFTGARHRALLPLSALTGAIVLLWADTLARVIFEPREVPVGILTALIGAPAFCWLLARSKA